MKGHIPEANLEGQGQGWWKTLFTNLLVLTWRLKYFWKKGNIKKLLWNRRLRLLCLSVHFILGFQENSIYTLHLCFSLQNGGCRVYTKTDSCFQNHMRSLDNFRKVLESPKSWSLMGYFCPKNIFFQLKHYTQRVYLISPVIFETIS